jgi:hypothetical protein
MPLKLDLIVAVRLPPPRALGSALCPGFIVLREVGVLLAAGQDTRALASLFNLTEKDICNIAHLRQHGCATRFPAEEAVMILMGWAHRDSRPVAVRTEV